LTQCVFTSVHVRKSIQDASLVSANTLYIIYKVVKSNVWRAVEQKCVHSLTVEYGMPTFTLESMGK